VHCQCVFSLCTKKVQIVWKLPPPNELLMHSWMEYHQPSIARGPGVQRRGEFASQGDCGGAPLEKSCTTHVCSKLHGGIAFQQTIIQTLFRRIFLAYWTLCRIGALPTGGPMCSGNSGLPTRPRPKLASHATRRWDSVFVLFTARGGGHLLDGRLFLPREMRLRRSRCRCSNKIRRPELLFI
jgi:hypothetical protein